MCRKRSFATHADRPTPASRRPTAPSRWTCSATPLQAAGIDDAANLYHDLASGVRADRPGLDSCLRALWKGDVLVVGKLDRLGRNLAHLVNTVQDLSARGVGLRLLAGDGAQIDTNAPADEAPAAAQEAPRPARLDGLYEDLRDEANSRSRSRGPAVRAAGPLGCRARTARRSRRRGGGGMPTDAAAAARTRSRQSLRDSPLRPRLVEADARATRRTVNGFAEEVAEGRHVSAGRVDLLDGLIELARVAEQDAAVRQRECSPAGLPGDALLVLVVVLPGVRGGAACEARVVEHGRRAGLARCLALGSTSQPTPVRRLQPNRSRAGRSVNGKSSGMSSRGRRAFVKMPAGQGVRLPVSRFLQNGVPLHRAPVVGSARRSMRPIHRSSDTSQS